MKKLKEDTLIKIVMIFIGVFFSFFLSAYLLLRDFLFTNTPNYQQILSDFNLLCFEIFLVALGLLVFIVYHLKKINRKVTEDINEIRAYVIEVSEDKNYNAVIKIKHYIEFLEISLILKNIVKRLHQKTKKASKK